MGPNTVYRDVALLHPELAGAAKRLHDHLIRGYETERVQFRFEIFETFRSPVRQAHLITKKTTKAGPWQSAHQYGLAVDFVPYLTEAEAAQLSVGRAKRVPKGWCWDAIPNECWEYLDMSADLFGVHTPYGWDRPHVEHPLFDMVRQSGLV